jgi:hypothetical protein
VYIFIGVRAMASIFPPKTTFIVYLGPSRTALGYERLEVKYKLIVGINIYLP